MGDSQTFLNMKYFTRHPILVDDKGRIISNKIELQKVFKLCGPSFSTLFKHLPNLNSTLHFLKFGRPNLAYQLGLLDFGRYSFNFHPFFNLFLKLF